MINCWDLNLSSEQHHSGLLQSLLMINIRSIVFDFVSFLPSRKMWGIAGFLLIPDVSLRIYVNYRISLTSQHLWPWIVEKYIVFGNPSVF